ncbi:MAG: hypothetical protein AB4042_11235 [Leptolyngbyaceae cyanobacterium]
MSFNIPSIARLLIRQLLWDKAKLALLPRTDVIKGKEGDRAPLLH